jgi:deoxyribodipyrimidine photolyase
VQDLARQLRAKGSRLILLECRSRSVGFAESAEVICTLSNKLKVQGQHPQLFFNRDMQEESDRLRDAQVIQFCQEAKIPCQIGLSNFLQTVHRWDDWCKEYYDYVHQPVHKVPELINTPEINDLPDAELIIELVSFVGTLSLQPLLNRSTAESNIDSSILTGLRKDSNAEMYFILNSLD